MPPCGGSLLYYRKEKPRCVVRIVVKQAYEQERGTALKPFPIDWHLVGVPLPTFLLARWACSSTFSTSNATLSYDYYSIFIL